MPACVGPEAFVEAVRNLLAMGEEDKPKPDVSDDDVREKLRALLPEVDLQVLHMPLHGCMPRVML